MDYDFLETNLYHSHLRHKDESSAYDLSLLIIRVVVNHVPTKQVGTSTEIDSKHSRA